MSQRKSKKNQDNSASSSPKRFHWVGTVSIVVALVAVAATLFFVKKSHVAEEVKRVPGQLIETRPVVPASQYSGKTATAYKYAAEIPEVIDAQFCFCFCKENKSFNHKTLLTCFTDNHGAMCGICQNEVIRSYDLYKAGTPIEKIQEIINAEFGKKKHSH